MNRQPGVLRRGVGWRHQLKGCQHASKCLKLKTRGVWAQARKTRELRTFRATCDPFRATREFFTLPIPEEKHWVGLRFFPTYWHGPTFSLYNCGIAVPLSTFWRRPLYAWGHRGRTLHALLRSLDVTFQVLGGYQGIFKRSNRSSILWQCGKWSREGCLEEEEKQTGDCNSLGERWCVPEYSNWECREKIRWNGHLGRLESTKFGDQLDIASDEKDSVIILWVLAWVGFSGITWVP